MNWSSERLGAAHVMVVGCGALGNEVLKNLVLMGVEHLILVDFDYVERSNLTRSILYRHSDVGEPKVEVAKRALLQLNPRLSVQALFADITCEVGLGLFRKVDVVIGCVDSRWARYCIQRLCLRAGKTWVDGGIIELEGTVRVFRPGKNCYACALGEHGLDELRKRMPCSGVIRRKEEANHAPTTPLIASVIGAVQAQEAIKIILGQSDGRKMFYYEGEHLTTRTLDFQAWDDDCVLHEEWIVSEPFRTEEGQPVVWDCDTPVRQVIAYGDLLLNDPFVDYLVHRANDQRTVVMQPAHRVSDFVERHPQLRYEPLSRFYQHEYREINASFPYLDLTLGEIGVPAHDVLRLRREEGVYYIMMS